MNIRALIFSIIIGLLFSIIIYFLLIKPARLKRIQEKETRTKIGNILSGFIDRYADPSEREEYNDLFDKLEDFKFFGFNIRNFTDFITIKIILVGFAILLSLIIKLPFPKLVILVVFVIVAWKLPDIKLSREIKILDKRITYDLPYIAEIIGLGMESGMNFNESVYFLAENTKGKITDLLKEAYFKFTAGEGEERSYINAAKKSLCEEFVNLIRTVFQNKKLGMPVSDAIFRQAENIRYKNALDLKLKVERIPIIATLVIMAFFFFPILIVMIAPVIFEVFKLFTG